MNHSAAVLLYTQMLLNNEHDFFEAFFSDTLDLREVFLNLPQVDGFAIVLKQTISVTHQERLKFITAHFLDRPIGIAVYNFLF